MTKINKVFDKYFDLCETILFQLYRLLYFRFPLHSSTGEAAVTARAWSTAYLNIMYIFNHSRNVNWLQVKLTKLVTTAQQLLTPPHVLVILSKRN